MFGRKPRSDESDTDVDVAPQLGRGWGPFTGRQLTLIVCVGIVAAVAIPTAAMAVIGTFTSSTVTPAVTGTNSAAVAGAAGVSGVASSTDNVNTRYGVAGTAAGTQGVGVQGTGTKYGVLSNGPLGVAAGKSLSCSGCVTRSDLASTAVQGQPIYLSTATFTGPYTANQTVATFTGVPAGTLCATATASAYVPLLVPSLVTLKFYGGSAGSNAPNVFAQKLFNVAGSHEALVSRGRVCVSNWQAGTVTYKGTEILGGASSDANDIGSLTLEVYRS